MSRFRRNSARVMKVLMPPWFRDRLAERRIDAQHRQGIKRAKAAGDRDAVELWETEWASDSWDLEQSQRLRVQHRLFRKARRLYVPVPSLTEANSVEGVIMDDAVIGDLVEKIRAAQKAQQELWLPWIQAVASLISLLIGLVGAAAALFSVFLKR